VHSEKVWKISSTILDIPIKAFEIIKLLWRYEALTVSEISRHLGVSRRLIYDYIRHLKKHRLVSRRPHIENGRLVYIYHAVSPKELKNRVRMIFDSLMGEDDEEYS
jgi:predicted transcriptional regulator